MAVRERTVLHALLIVVVAFNAILLLRESSTIAMAQEESRETLGPVASLTLEGEEGTLTLTTADTHLAWGEEETHRAWSIAFCHLGKILPKMMQSDHVQSELEALNTELTDASEEMDAQLREIAEELEGLDPESADAAGLRERGNQLVQQMRRLQQFGTAEMSRLNASHMQASYQELVEAVNVVADRLKIDIVYRFIPSEDPFLSQDIDGTMTEIQLRTALRAPETIDITAEVMEELAIEE